MGTFAGRQDVRDLPSNMGAEFGRACRSGGEQPRIPAIDIAGPLGTSGERVPQRLEPIAAVEGDRLDATMLPYRGRFAASWTNAAPSCGGGS